LQEAGYAVVGIAATASEAEAIARATRPTLAIMDIHLAGRRDGVDAAMVLYESLGIRSLFATAHEDAEMRRRASVAKPLGWLAKPFSPPSLLGAVKKAIAQLS
jgi:DNA-binding NarL/FixJ family response regulator